LRFSRLALRTEPPFFQIVVFFSSFDAEKAAFFIASVAKNFQEILTSSFNDTFLTLALHPLSLDFLLLQFFQRVAGEFIC
jgi:hypothetical protein